MGCDELALSGIVLEVRYDAEYFGLAGLVEAIDEVQWRAEQVAKEAVEKESELQWRAKQVAQTDEIMKDKKVAEKERVLVEECARKASEILIVEFKKITDAMNSGV